MLVQITQRTTIPELKITEKLSEVKILGIALEAITESFQEKGYLLDWGTLCVHTSRGKRTGRLEVEVKMQAIDMTIEGDK